MIKLSIVGAKPNPVGKDKNGDYTIHEQLLGEWIEIKNLSSVPVNIDKLKVYSRTHDNMCNRTGHNLMHTFNYLVLNPGEIVRVHSGKGLWSVLMRSEDRTGAHYHVYRESLSFVLNNKCGDKIELWNDSSDCFDAVEYRPNPPEGKVLRRIGNILQ